MNLLQLLPQYTIEENPALEDGRSVKEIEALNWLKEWARRGIAEAGTPGIYVQTRAKDIEKVIAKKKLLTA